MERVSAKPATGQAEWMLLRTIWRKRKAGAWTERRGEGMGKIVLLSWCALYVLQQQQQQQSDGDQMQKVKSMFQPQLRSIHEQQMRGARPSSSHFNGKMHASSPCPSRTARHSLVHSLLTTDLLLGTHRLQPLTVDTHTLNPPYWHWHVLSIVMTTAWVYIGCLLHCTARNDEQRILEYVSWLTQSFRGSCAVRNDKQSILEYVLWST